MYPLNVVLTGCGESLLPHVRRELSNRSARVEGEYAGVRETVDGLAASPDAMRLFIVHLRSADDLPRLKRLSGTFVGRPILALVDSESGPSMVIAAMREGAAQVVPLPLQAEDFKAALDCVALQFGRPAALSRVIAVSGVTGGCGATTVAINLAYEMAHLHHKHCILAELSFQVGMLATYLDRTPRYSTYDLLRYQNDLDVHVVQQALTNVADNFDILAGPHESIAPGAVSSEDVKRMIDYSRRLADVVVLDVPCTYDDHYFETLLAADQVVLIGEQRIPSIRNLNLVLETLRRDGGAQARYPVLNRYDPRVDGFGTADLEGLLKVPQLYTIASDYPSVTAAVNHGRPLRLEAPRSPALSDVDRLVRTLLAIRDQPEPKAEGSGMLRRLMHTLCLA